jgi:hypothetical protein
METPNPKPQTLNPKPVGVCSMETAGGDDDVFYLFLLEIVASISSLNPRV